MPKPPTFPILYDDALQLSITKLREWGYLKRNHYRGGTLTWSRNGNRTGRISIHVDTIDATPSIELDYKYNDEPRKYKVRLVTIPSNLGIGEVWYFLCPHTGKRCRKLYSIGGYFLHREAFKGCMYDSQTKSKKWRQIEKVFGAAFDVDKAYEQLYSKHFKTHYGGKPTKRYLRIQEMIRRSELINPEDWERLLIS